jgi:hypothetical protein
MSIGCIIIIVLYFAMGILLAFIWWNDEYKAEYEYEKAEGDMEEPMTKILILALIVLWPVKAIKNCLDHE